MNAAISTSSRGARRRSSACSTSGKLVVAPSRTAQTRADHRLRADGGERAARTPSADRGRRDRRGDERDEDRDEQQSGRTTRARRQSVLGRYARERGDGTSATRARDAHAARRAAASRPRRRSPPASPSSFARGSSRWIGLVGSRPAPRSSAWSQPGSRRAVRRRADRIPTGEEHAERAHEAGAPLPAARRRCRGTRSPSGGRPGSTPRPVGEALVLGDPVEAVGRRDANGETETPARSRPRPGRGSRPTP